MNVDERKQRTLNLTLTQACNLKCSYCYEGHKSKETMQYENAVKILENELNKEDAFDFVEIDFFGGEPFLAFDVMKRLVEYVLSREWRHDYVFFATTNGTLVHDNIKEWLRKHTDCFICGLSYDGTPAMHDRNRDDSSGNIDLDFFAENYPDQPIKMTISQETLPDLYDGVIFLHSKGFEVSCNLAYNIDWSDERNEDLLTTQLRKLIDYYLANPEITPCSLLDMGIRTNNPKEQMFRYCGCGISITAYDVDGKSYPCQMFMPLSVGNEKAKKVSELVFYPDTIPDSLLDPKCRDCIVKSACPTCYGANYLAYGNIYLHEENYCRLFKSVIKARSYFKGCQWELGQLDLDTEEEHQLLADIVKIQEEL